MSENTHLDPFDELRIQHGFAPLTPMLEKLAAKFKKWREDRWREEYHRLAKEKEAQNEQ